MKHSATRTNRIIRLLLLYCLQPAAVLIKLTPVQPQLLPQQQHI
jgi:hypothetical protein